MPRPIQSCIRCIAKVAASALLMAMVAGASVPRQSASLPATPGNTVAAGDYYPMVHLRKLHLVRPDLIPYPIYYAVYC